MADEEIEAMAAVKAALKDLDDDTREHVIRWAADRFGVSLGRVRATQAKESVASASGEFEDIGALFHAANPSTDAEKALVGGYWVQVEKGQDTFDSATVNAELKNLGHNLSNITRSYDDLRARHPALIRQVQKSGKTKQARKRYKVTDAGEMRVAAMLAGSEEGS